ncbi:MAG: DNA internalization-related competence protein ComEC/Rec2 [Oscillospiraceae bacterium]|nr:DNA internalization-related competence protein ComEC/Rec2 [Oscillospiraceae bacterium]
MRRLAWAAGAFSAAIIAANYLPAGGWLLPSAAVLLLFGLALATLRRRWLRAAVISCIAAALGLGCFALHAQTHTIPAKSIDKETRFFTATVMEYPVVHEGYIRVELRVRTDVTPPLRCIFYDRSGATADAEPGDRLSGEARFTAADTRYGRSYSAYHAQDIYLQANASEGVTLEKTSGFRLSAFAAKMNRALTDQVAQLFPEDVSGFFLALMLGEKGELYRDDAMYTALNRSGIMHIVAVSGMHVAFLVGLLQLLLGNNRRSALLGITLVWLFVAVTGGSPSAVRAAFMQTTLLLAPILRRENDPPTSLFTALAVLLLFNPRAAASVSLQLSFASVSGLLLFSRHLFEALHPRRAQGLLRILLSYLAGNAAASFSALVFAIPLIAIYFNSIPLLSPLTNILVLWCVPICFGGAYLACGISFLLPWLGSALALLVSWPARYLLAAAGLIAKIPFASLYLSDRLMPYWLALTYILLLSALIGKRRRRGRWLVPALVSLLTLCIALLAARVYYASGTGFITALDVGQGQSLAVFSGDSTVVVDCGNINSTENAGEITGDFLLGCGRRRVDVLLLTHLHTDHADGVLRLMELIPVRCILMPPDVGEEDSLYGPICASADRHGTTLVYVSEDGVLEAGTIRMELYAPGEAGRADKRCLTTKISLGDYDMLVTGDIDAAAERELLSGHEIEDVELLIVGHHGSRYSSCRELLSSIGADTAIISVGYNSYGHPTEETLERLDTYGYTVYRTDLDGRIEIRVA